MGAKASGGKVAAGRSRTCEAEEERRRKNGGEREWKAERGRVKCGRWEVGWRGGWDETRRRVRKAEGEVERAVVELVVAMGCEGGREVGREEGRETGRKWVPCSCQVPRVMGRGVQAVWRNGIGQEVTVAGRWWGTWSSEAKHSSRGNASQRGVPAWGSQVRYPFDLTYRCAP